MPKRERILQLVRDGILSVDEGLDLLESIHEKETEKTAEKEFTSSDSKTFDEESVRAKETEEEKQEENNCTADEKESIHKEVLEKIANRLNKYSVEIDHMNEEGINLRKELTDVREELAEEKRIIKENYTQRKEDLENEVVNLHKEIELIRSVNATDHSDELENLNNKLTEVMEELDALEEQETNEKIDTLNEKEEQLTMKMEEIQNKKNEKLKEMHSLKMKQWSTKAKQVSEKMDIPEDWRKNADKTIDKAGDFFDETAQTFKEVLRQTFKTTKDTIENIDWKDLDGLFNMNKKIEAEFKHEWVFEDTTATILDFKNANGNMQFKTSTDDTIKVQAKIKLYTNFDESSELEAFENRSTITIDEDQFTFQVPNKNIVADMIVYLPKREYDYIRSNIFNGNVKFDEIKTKDIFVKTTNGDIIFDQLKGTMLEIKGTNGNITLNSAKLRDLLIHTANSDVRIIGNVLSSDIQTTNGTLRLTLHGKNLIRLVANTVNGDVKVSIPMEQSLEIDAKTTFGKLRSRLSNVQSNHSKELKRKNYKINRQTESDLYRGFLSTTTGNILLKDTIEK